MSKQNLRSFPLGREAGLLPALASWAAAAGSEGAVWVPSRSEFPCLPTVGSRASSQGRLSSPSGSKFSSWTGAPSVPSEPSADQQCPGAQGPVGLRVAPPSLRLELLQAEGREPHPQAPQPCLWSEQVSRSPFPGAGPTSRAGPLSRGRRPDPWNSGDKQLVNNSVLAGGN